ncbi:unnamed protein product [Polarella glacialis]|uniref:Carboxylic ester hydrolase n=1 Tax=Polarella glacialis TaxID=89957 RepID=A0A813EDD8_POLGL|nr:unnamed protein product [Polarella glacialis]
MTLLAALSLCGLGGIAGYPSDVFDVRPSVTTLSGGKLSGIVEGGVQVFRGIPYAAPPVKDFRWMPPQPPIPWSGVRDASAYGNTCLQGSAKGEGSEDCLYLNVYSPPSLPAGNANTSLPCLVWIHGGAYEFGSSNQYNASELGRFYMQSEQPAVIVTMNYRLNIFGFLGSDALRGSDGSTGNFGIQDQRAALRWVRSNIAVFGGDPERVMIFGQSAGAGSVTMHLSMPLSAGLFSSAIMESGAFSAWTAQPLSYSEKVYQQVLNVTGCMDAACLRNFGAAELVRAYKELPVGQCCRDTAGNPWIPWAPTVDGVELTQHPWDLVRIGRVNKVPLILGTNTDDGASFEPLSYLTSIDHYKTAFNSWYGQVMGTHIASLAAAAYLSNENHAEVPELSDAWWAAERSMTDQNFACPARFASSQLASHGVSLYQYLFSHVQSSTLHKPVVFHGDEVPFVFLMASSKATLEEKAFAEEMASYWYRHAAFGNPNVQSNGSGPVPPVGPPVVPWPKVEHGTSGSYLRFDTKGKGGIRAVHTPFREGPCKFMTEWLEKSIAASRAGAMTLFL